MPLFYYTLLGPFDTMLRFRALWGLLMISHHQARAENDASLLTLHVNNTWVDYLHPDPDAQLYTPNKQARDVVSGHFVLVEPTRLPSPGIP